MDDALAVRGVEPLGRLAADAQHLAEGERRRQALAAGEVGAGDELEGEVEDAVGLAGVEQGHDVRVDEPARRPRLADQADLALLDLGLGGVADAHRLERQLAVDVRVLRQEDLAHGAGAEAAFDAVAAERGAGVEGHPTP